MANLLTQWFDADASDSCSHPPWDITEALKGGKGERETAKDRKG